MRTALAVLLLAACTQSSVTRDSSEGVQTPVERVARLKKHLVLRSDVDDCAFTAFISNQGGLGPSEWDVRAAMKVTAIEPWLANARPEKLDGAAARALLAWPVTGEPETYRRETTRIFVWRKEQVVVMLASTLP